MFNFYLTLLVQHFALIWSIGLMNIDLLNMKELKLVMKKDGTRLVSVTVLSFAGAKSQMSMAHRRWPKMVIHIYMPLCNLYLAQYLG